MITVDVSFIITYENAERILKNLKVHLAIYFLLVMNMLERKSKENGQNVTTDVLLRICDVLECDISEIVECVSIENGGKTGV